MFDDRVGEDAHDVRVAQLQRLRAFGEGRVGQLTADQVGGGLGLERVAERLREGERVPALLFGHGRWDQHRLVAAVESEPGSELLDAERQRRAGFATR
jgi:hypothetical protein